MPGTGFLLRGILKRMLGEITDLFRESNNVEAVFWWIVGALAFKAARDRHFPCAAFAFLITLLIFGVSDLVEARTGAWWRPWWLFLWKAVCVVTLVGLLTGCRRSAVGAKHASPAADDGRPAGEQGLDPTKG